jgi:hypothetical protein
MIPNLVLAAIIGWCGTGWPIHFRGGGGGGGVEPGDWPPNCWVCGPLVGAISAVILVAVLESTIASSGLVGLATVAFFGGSFGSSLIGGLRSTMSGR